MRARTDLDNSEIETSYRGGESALSISRRLKCSVWSILSRLRRIGCEVRSADEQNARWLGDRTYPSNLDTVNQLLDGILLGDGGIDPKGCLRLQQRQSCVGWLLQLQEQLVQAGCESTILPIPTPKLKKCEGRLIQGGPSSLLYTVCYKEFKPQVKRWYPSGVKVVPQDLVLTSLSVAHWMCGDGTSNKDGSLVFCTDGFTLEDVQLLILCLSRDLGVVSTPHRSSREGQFKVMVGRKEEAFKLAALVRPFLPECFLYKIQHVSHTKSNPWWQRSRKLTPDAVRVIRASGASLSKLAKTYSVSRRVVQLVRAGETYQDV
jgi:hypothetical protein